MSQLEIVPAQPSDLERYIEGLESVASWLESRGIVQWPLGSFARQTDYFAECIQRVEVHLALLYGRFVGTIRLLPTDPLVWPDVADDALYIHSLAVFRPWAGQQFGAQLLSWAEEQALEREKPYLRCDCIASNPFLRSYYTQHGFRSRGERDVTFPQGTYKLARFEKRVAGSLRNPES